jgi:hypothetical protein
MRSQIYFPIVRAKAGEFGAMAALSERTKPLVCPILDLPFVEAQQDFERSQAHVAKKLASSWGTANELLLDLSRYDPDAVTADGVPYVTRLFDSARQVGLRGIPVAGPLVERYGTTGKYLQALARIAERDGRGAAIRLPWDEIQRPEKLNATLDEILRAIHLSDTHCDLILDIGPMDKLSLTPAQASSFLRDAASVAIGEVSKRQFRAFALCASSIPRSLGRNSDTIPYRVPNFEFQAWKQLVSSPSCRRVRFGDYGARYAHQTDKRTKSNPPARIHISTTDNHVLGVGESSTYRELARIVSALPEFEMQCGSWGKYAVRDAAGGRGKAGAAADWVERDTHMHIETMTSAVSGSLLEIGLHVEQSSEAAARFDQVELEI